jgi:diaminohydroxyphosphoribosylaminopyrimidine deaminase/5-amino-6-(5-phosphoribosylamino)uracil reductase
LKLNPQVDLLNFERAMLHANKLSLVGLGLTAPNPIVGAVILDSAGNVVATGFHAIGDHAEIVALKSAQQSGKTDFSDCTMVVTLEPCNNFGKTPPCSEALIKAGFKTVVYGVSDPNKSAAGGAEKLIAAGINVLSGIQQEYVAFTNRFWLNKVKQGRPWIVSKIAMTLDGKIAAQDRSSKWITSEQARQDVAQLRNYSDAIVTSTATVLADNPELTPRFVNEVNPTGRSKNPIRVVIGKREIPAEFKIHNHLAKTEFIKSNSFDELLSLAKSYGWNQILVESGSRFNTALFESGLIDELVIYVAPALLGSGFNFIEDLGIYTLSDRRELSFGEIKRIGPDLRVQLFTSSNYSSIFEKPSVQRGSR